MGSRKVPGMPGWVDLGSDMSWEDYGGKWGRLARDGSVYVVRFENMYDAQAKYVAESLRVALPEKAIDDALKCVGAYINRERGEIVDDMGYVLATRSDARQWAYVLAEACVSYGLYEPLESFSGDVRPTNLRAKARRACEVLMRDTVALETARARPVNQIGSTAAEYGRGDLDSALERGPCDMGKQIMRRLQGLAPVPETFGGES